MIREHLYHPADELAEVRAKIRKLKAREAALKAHLARLPQEARTGDRFRATFQRRHIRRLIADSLPENIRDNPDHYRITTCSFCTVTPKRNAPVQPGDDRGLESGANDALIERFG